LFILCSAVLHKLEDKTADVLYAYERFGPTPRICLDFVRNDKVGLSTLGRLVKTKLREITPAKLREIVSDVVSSGSVETTEVSHVLFLVERLSENEPREENEDSNRFSKYGDTVIKPITLAIKEKLLERFALLNLEEQFYWYSHFAQYNNASFLTGIFFELIIHRRFREVITLDLFPMTVKRGGTKKRSPQWKSTHSHGTAQPTIEIHPVDVNVYSKPGPKTIEQDVYYVPESKTQVAFDSFIMTNKALYLFQVTLASIHEIKPGILPFFKPFLNKSLRPNIPWVFVFVLPHDSEISCPQPKDCGLKEKLQNGIGLFSIVIDVKALESIMTSAPPGGPGGLA